MKIQRPDSFYSYLIFQRIGISLFDISLHLFLKHILDTLVRKLKIKKLKKRGEKKRIVCGFLAESRIILRQNCENKKKGRCIDFWWSQEKKREGIKKCSLADMSK